MAANLTKVAITTRKSIRYGIYFLIFVMVARMSWSVLNSIRKIVFPPPPPPPTVGFSRLPQIPFPSPSETLPEFKFTIDTTTGTLPTFPESMPIYYIPTATATLNSVDDARAKALALGFDSQPTPITQTIFRFESSKVPSTLEMNIVNGTFSTSYNLAADASPLANPPPPPQAAQSIARGILNSAKILPEDLTVFGKPDFLKVEGQALVNALALSEADLIRINMYRKPFGENEEYLSLTAKTNVANVWFIISGAREQEKQVIASEFHYFPLDEEKVETYPIKTATQAVENLLAGQAHIANLGLNKDGQVTIRRIYLAYYDPDVTSQFYQPIIVFEGEKNFVAYVPAVSSEYYGE